MSLHSRFNHKPLSYGVRPIVYNKIVGYTWLAGHKPLSYGVRPIVYNKIVGYTWLASHKPLLYDVRPIVYNNIVEYTWLAGHKPLLYGVNLLFTTKLYDTNDWLSGCPFVFQGVNITGFIMATELFPPKQRTIYSVSHEFLWAIGGAFLPFFAYFMRTWGPLQITVSAPGILALFLWWYVFYYIYNSTNNY